MGSTVEPIVNAPTPTGAYGWVGVDVDGDESLLGERLMVVLVRPDIANVILWVIRPLFGAAGATVVEDRSAGRNGAEGEASDFDQHYSFGQPSSIIVSEFYRLAL